MGGRGRDSGVANRQLNIEEYEKRVKIKSIIEGGEIYRNSVPIGNGAANNVPRLYKRCACCKQFTIPMDEQYYICEVCGWIDDEYQNKHPESLDGRNKVSLNEAQRKYSEMQK